MNRVRLLVFNPVLSVLDYRLPAGMATEFGSLVIAPLGPRQVLGIVWEPERLAGTEVPESKLRPILEVLPVPPFLIDVLLALNIGMSLLVLLAIVYVKEPPEFSGFPVMLLGLTLFRLALNISSTRQILSNGYAGEIIESFEGIGDSGLTMLDWMENDDDRVQALMNVYRAGIGTEAAWQLHGLGWPVARVAESLAARSLVGGDGWVSNRVKFIQSPSRAVLIWSYWWGERVVTRAWQQVGAYRRDAFLRFLYGRMHSNASLEMFE